MAGESKFAKIKRIVEEEKNKKVRGEARLTSLQEEESRILEQVTSEVGHSVSSIDEVTKISDDLKDTIESDIEKMAAILREEGIEV